MAFVRSSDVHPCPAPDCSIVVPNRFFACRYDWFRLPPELKQGINRTAKAGMLSPRRREALENALIWYRANPRSPATTEAAP
jgi:hypothetical protein